jgi:hypothetical protein
MDLEKRVEELEVQLAEMRTRMIEFENVMTTAFGFIMDGGKPKR